MKIKIDRKEQEQRETTYVCKREQRKMKLDS